MISARMNYSPECEQAVNEVIQMHQAASLTYDHLAAICASEQTNMPGFCKFFRLCSLRTRSIAQYWIRWQTMRGGKACLGQVRPLFDVNEFWKSGLNSLVQLAVDTERKLEQQWRKLHQLMQNKSDIAGFELVEHEHLQNQVRVIDLLVSHCNGLHMSQCPYMYDRGTMLELCKQIRRAVHRSQEQCDESKNTTHHCEENVLSFVSGISGKYL
ncbi:unnamed protein product [Echinostoma caproni]|uniref:Ferritin n=1 Tax=Echinostoma caproni TaxID=27848 RepID=A0A183AKA1_9TREM|nr:unnamed protein product [Echinostoma caproni]